LEYHSRLTIKFWMICSRGSGVMGFKVGGAVCSTFQSASSSSRTVHWMQTCFRCARKLQMFSTTMPNLVRLGLHAVL